jgi:hypothetical protein
VPSRPYPRPEALRKREAQGPPVIENKRAAAVNFHSNGPGKKGDVDDFVALLAALL